ncbi:hypothetical protein B0H12DRAFT_985671, partial [Mycena haematopus]
TPTTPVLEGPTNYNLWKIRMEGEFAREKVSLIISGEDTAATQAAAETAATSAIRDSFRVRDARARGIIHKFVSDSILMSVAHIPGAKETDFDAHIAKIRTGNLRMTSMARAVDDEFLGWILLKSLPETAQWRAFVSQTVNHVPDGGKLSFAGTEARIKAEIA